MDELSLKPEERAAISGIFNRPNVDLDKVIGLPSGHEPAYPGPESLSFTKITSIAFRDRRDIRKALSQFYGVLHAMKCRFIFLLECKAGEVNLYMGVDSAQGSSQIDSDELTHSLLGILPGCQVEDMGKGDGRALLERAYNYPESYLLTGVPTCNISAEKKEEHQEEEKARTGIERIVDSIAGEDFMLSILCEPMEQDELNEYRASVGDIYDIVKPLSKFSANQNQSVGGSLANGETINTTDGIQISEGTQNNETIAGQQENRRSKDGNLWDRMCNWVGVLCGGGAVAEHSTTVQVTPTISRGTTQTTTKTRSTTTGTTTTKTLSQSETRGINREYVSMELTAAASQLEKLHKRLLQASGEGMWKTCVMCHAERESVLQRAAFAATGIWNGDDSAIDPIRCIKIDKPANALMRSQYELLDLDFTLSIGKEQETQIIPLHPLGRAYSNLYTCLTHRELAHIANLPHWELPGITVLPLVEYGRTCPQPRQDNCDIIELGGLIDRTVNRSEPPHKMRQKVFLGYDQLNKHCFVSGVTGSGKSTTMLKLLRSLATHKTRRVPFMVIEPVKTEYRKLQEQGVDMLVFSPGRRRPGQETFSLNPFSFPEETGLLSHLDFLKSAFNALLGAYSSMPFLLEELLTKAYTQRGWDLSTGQHEILNRELQAAARINPGAMWRLREDKMPLISDLPDMVDDVLTACFGDDKSDYRISLRGALKARLKSLCSSMKGELLARHESHDFRDLLNRNVLFELEAFADNDEKAFIMALLLERLYEYRQAENLRGEIEPNHLRHVVVLEEAHRLLAKTESKGELQANPKAKAVETFTDMLAEVRSYGQGIIIVDQIPSKLTPDVMKNTEVKIAHRLLAQDDREAVGATMNLQKEQIEDLARHAPGEATMYFGNLTTALHVKIDPQ